MEDRRAHDRIDTLESVMQRHLEEHSSIEASLAENIVMTRAIAENTRELVDLMKGIKGLRALVLWVAPLVAAGIGIVTWLKGLK